MALDTTLGQALRDIAKMTGPQTEIAEKVVSKGFHRRVKFSCWARANDVKPDVADALKEMIAAYREQGKELPVGAALLQQIAVDV